MPDSHFTDPKYLVGEQYVNSRNLNARQNIHTRFSTNPYGWFLWLFDQIQLPEDSQILEIGCGSGNLWLENADRLPAGWKFILTDYSQGMVADARERLKNLPKNMQFAENDARFLPFPYGSFEAVFANHMLYHVPDIDQALKEIRRVLNPNGRFYAATNGVDHLAELDELGKEFFGSSYSKTNLAFNLENGAGQIGRHFSQVELRRYPDGLMVTEAEPLAGYLLSLIRIGLSETSKKDEADLVHFLENKIQQEGAIHIRKDPGLFIAQI